MSNKDNQPKEVNYYNQDYKMPVKCGRDDFQTFFTTKENEDDDETDVTQISCSCGASRSCHCVKKSLLQNQDEQQKEFVNTIDIFKDFGTTLNNSTNSDTFITDDPLTDYESSMKNHNHLTKSDPIIPKKISTSNKSLRRKTINKTNIIDPNENEKKVIENKDDRNNYIKQAKTQLYEICRIFFFYFNKRLIIKKKNEYKYFLLYYFSEYKSTEKDEKYFYYDDEKLRCTDFDKLLEKNSDEFSISDYPSKLLDEVLRSINSEYNTNLDKKMLYFIQKIGETFPSLENLKYFENIKFPREDFNNFDKLLEKVDKTKLNNYYSEIYNNLYILREDIEHYL